METIETAPVKPPITIDDLDKLDIRVGRITRVDDVEGSKKLIKMTVGFGGFTRTILSGMKEERDDCKAELEGRQALFVVNLVRHAMPLPRPRCSTSSRFQFNLLRASILKIIS